METNTRRINIYYPYLIWITTIVLAPILLALESWTRDKPEAPIEILNTAPLLVIFGLLCSFPSLCILLLLLAWLERTPLSAVWTKIALNIATIICIFLTFRIIAGSIDIEFNLIYSAAVIIASCFYKVLARRDDTG